MHDRFQKDKPFFIRVQYCPTSMKTEARLSKTQEGMRDNKQSTGKQHAGNQSEEDMSHRDRKGEKEEETGKEKRVN